MKFTKAEDETVTAGAGDYLPAPHSASGFRLTDKKVTSLLLLALGVLTCTAVVSVLRMSGTPVFVTDTTLEVEDSADENNQPLPELAPPPAPPAGPSQAEMAAVMEGERNPATAAAEPLASADGFSGNLTDIDPRCLEAPRMTPCSGSASRRPAFFFDGHRCVTPTSVPPPSCLDGRNRFRSLGHCRTACQGQDARAECGEPAQLAACSREHVKRRWFYPTNGSCVEWAFPEGSCVSAAVGLFQRMRQCVHDCLEHDAAPACMEAPVAQRCGDYQVRYPVYSSMSKSGRFECLTVDPADIRCLLGRNTFPSYRECARACLVS